MALIVRRRRLGRTSCNAITDCMQNNAVVWRSDRLFPNYRDGDSSLDYIFRWGCTANLPINGKIINTAEAIHQVNNKLGFRKILNDSKLCPKTWFSCDDIHTALTPTLRGTYPLIVRPAKHAQGRNLHVCKNYDDVFNYCYTYGIGNYYISELINKVAEYRVCIVSGRAIWIAKKTPGNTDDVAWNVARGGRFDNVRWDDWPLKVVKYAINAFNLSLLDFGGVDVMLDAEGNCYILEINSAPSLTSPYRQQCMAKAFDYIIDNGKERIPLIDNPGGYRKFIHPAVCSSAILL